MPRITTSKSGSGTVTSVTSANDSIAVATGTTTAILTVGTVDKLFTNHAPAAAMAANGQKLTGLAAGTVAGDSLRYEQVFAAGAVPIADIADPTAGKVIGSSGGAAAAVLPPGYEIGYTAITSPVNVTGTTEGAATVIISPGALTFDGSPVLCQIFAAYLAAPTVVGQTLRVGLFESTTDVSGIIMQATCYVASANAIYNVSGWLRFTPTVGAHTYTVQAYVTSTTGTPAFGAGAGGTAASVPAFVRFTKV